MMVYYDTVRFLRYLSAFFERTLSFQRRNSSPLADSLPLFAVAVPVFCEFDWLLALVAAAAGGWIDSPLDPAAATNKGWGGASNVCRDRGADLARPLESGCSLTALLSRLVLRRSLPSACWEDGPV